MAAGIRVATQTPLTCRQPFAFGTALIEIELSSPEATIRGAVPLGVWVMVILLLPPWPSATVAPPRIRPTSRPASVLRIAESSRRIEPRSPQDDLCFDGVDRVGVRHRH